MGMRGDETTGVRHIVQRVPGRIAVLLCVIGDDAWSPHLYGDATCDIVAVAASAAEALSQARRLAPRVVVVGCDGRDLRETAGVVRVLRRSASRLDVVGVAPRSDERWVRRVLRAGARGYLYTGDDADVGRAVRAVASGGAFFSPTVADLVRRGYLRRGGIAIDALLARLDDGDRAVLWWLVHGLSSVEIAAELAMPAEVVGACRRRIVAALG